MLRLVPLLLLKLSVWAAKSTSSLRKSLSRNLVLQVSVLTSRRKTFSPRAQANTGNNKRPASVMRADLLRQFRSPMKPLIFSSKLLQTVDIVTGLNLLSILPQVSFSRMETTTSDSRTVLQITGPQNSSESCIFHSWKSILSY